MLFKEPQHAVGEYVRSGDIFAGQLRDILAEFNTIMVSVAPLQAKLLSLIFAHNDAMVRMGGGVDPLTGLEALGRRRDDS